MFILCYILLNILSLFLYLMFLYILLNTRSSHIMSVTVSAALIRYLLPFLVIVRRVPVRLEPH